MEIVILPEPADRLFAWEVQLGDRTAQFLLADDGSILYRHPDDDHDWIASSSRERFIAAAQAWNRYTLAVQGKPEHEQLIAAQGLRRELTTAGALDGNPGSFWELLLEQAEDGFL